MRLSLLAAIAATALAAGAGQATAQPRQHMPARAPMAARAPVQPHPAAMGQRMAQHPAAIPGRAQGRSAAVATRAPGAARAAAVRRTAPQRATAERRPASTAQTAAARRAAQQRVAAVQGGSRLTERRSVAPVRLSHQQRSGIHRLVTNGALHTVTNPNFNVAVGAVIPATVAIFPVPAAIVDIVPEYAGFDYIVVGYELLIIDPYTLAIVAIIPV
jgi:hypothetical protein